MRLHKKIYSSVDQISFNPLTWLARNDSLFAMEFSYFNYLKVIALRITDGSATKLACSLHIYVWCARFSARVANATTLWFYLLRALTSICLFLYLETRSLEANRIREKYPDQYPVIVLRSRKSKLPPLDKHKFLLSGEMTLAQVRWIYYITSWNH